MDLNRLSSNWKHLQQQLKTQDKPKHNQTRKNDGIFEDYPKKKRKPLDEIDHSPKAKRPKIAVAKKRSTAEPAYSGREMGLSISSLTTPEPPAGSVLATTTADADQSSKAGRYIALDCEMVGTATRTAHSVPSSQNPKEHSILARVSVVNYAQAVLYDAYVLPPPGVAVSNYRTEYSGITPAHLTSSNAKPFSVVHEEIAKLIDGRVIVGHQLGGDLTVLGVAERVEKWMVRDTAKYRPFRELARERGVKGRIQTPSLKKLARLVLGQDVQVGRDGHDSVEDARTAMELYKKEKAAFEEDVAKRYGFRGGVNGNEKAHAVDGECDIEDDDEKGDGNVDEKANGMGKRKKKKKKKKKKRN